MKRRTLLKAASTTGAIPAIGVTTSAEHGSHSTGKPDSFSEIPPGVKRRYEKRKEILHQEGPQELKKHVENSGGIVVESENTNNSDITIQSGDSFPEIFLGIGMSMVVDCEDDRYVSAHAWSKIDPFGHVNQFSEYPYCPGNPDPYDVNWEQSDVFGMAWEPTQYSGFSDSYNVSNNICLDNGCGDIQTSGFAGEVHLADQWKDFREQHEKNEKVCDLFWGGNLDGMLYVEDPSDPPATREVHCDYHHTFNDCSLNVSVGLPPSISVGSSCEDDTWEYQGYISEDHAGEGCHGGYP